MTISSVCPKCGMTKKSGKMSCCGLGGSWFGNCGSAGGTKLDHTWYEGLHACKARRQSKAVIGQQLKEARKQKDDSSNGNDFMAAKPLAFTSGQMPDAPPIIAPDHMPANTLTTYAAFTIKSEQNTAAVTMAISMSANLSTATPNITTGDAPNTTSLRMVHNDVSAHTSYLSRMYTSVGHRCSYKSLGYRSVVCLSAIVGIIY